MYIHTLWIYIYIYLFIHLLWYIYYVYFIVDKAGQVNDFFYMYNLTKIKLTNFFNHVKVTK